ncbi:hypothetical protein [Clostridium sp. DSM 8431]|uniref:hypothetical protein n=1 Tax=Clostridium sp. DSM 8431 TaxID=1761781 RepID=UPI000B7DAEB7|nr:hypothetical protein [Clostridium sp. DSM 8431]
MYWIFVTLWYGLKWLVIGIIKLCKLPFRKKKYIRSMNNTSYEMDADNIFADEDEWIEKGGH